MPYTDTTPSLPAERQRVIDRVLAEVDRAERKHPCWPSDVIHAAAIVAEESGEMMRAAVRATYEDGGLAEAEAECIQVAATALRFLMHSHHVRPSDPAGM